MSMTGRCSLDAALDGAPEAVWRGVRAFKNAQYSEALHYLRQPAHDGDLQSCLLLSRMYFAGHGVAKDKSQYLYWLARSAVLGDPAARAKIKRLALDAEVVQWLREDSSLRDIFAQLPIGLRE